MAGAGRAWARWALAGTAALFAAGVVVQVFYAGLASFVGPGWWLRHKAFVHAFEWASPLAIVLAYVARASRAAKSLAWGTVALLMAQYVTAGLRERGAQQSIAAVHAVTAMILFWAAVELVRLTWREARIPV